MMQSLFSAKMGIKAQQLRADTIANNIANINTTGFKSSRVSFKDALNTTMIRPVKSNEEPNLQQGNGVMVSAINKSFVQGTPVETGVPLDMRIEGDGFFTIDSGEGEQYYTRSGAFAVSNENNVHYLVNSRGDYVLDTGMNRIELPDSVSDVAVNSEGGVFGNDTLIAQLNIVSFANKNGLSSVGKGGYVETAASGGPFSSETAIVHQGSLESSNVDLSIEMTKLIRAQRALSLVSKALKTSDEMSAMTNNMR